MNKLNIVLLATPLIFVVSCANMPTPPSQITAAHNTGIAYEEFSVERLQVELDSLKRRESQLVIAQEQRVKTSQTQAFWWGFGQGDGIEASELAVVKGQIEAVQRALAAKGIEAPE
jgi:hypothetical protein